MPQKTIEAVVEMELFEVEPLWTVASVANWSRLRLFSGVTDEEIGSIILTACSYNHHLEIQRSAIETLNAFVAEDFVLPGGLQFSEDEQIKIVPGCCAGLEDWREWLDVPNGNTIWAGHDPSPGVEFVDGGIRVWQDEKADEVNFIDFGVDEMRDLLKRVEFDLKGFVFRLNEWANFVAPSLQKKIVEHFAKNYGHLTDNAAPNKSMDVRAKQRLCYQTGLVTFSGLGGGFAPRHLSRSASSLGS